MLERARCRRQAGCVASPATLAYPRGVRFEPGVGGGLEKSCFLGRRRSRCLMVFVRGRGGTALFKAVQKFGHFRWAL